MYSYYNMHCLLFIPTSSLKYNWVNWPIIGLDNVGTFLHRLPWQVNAKEWPDKQSPSIRHRKRAVDRSIISSLMFFIIISSLNLYTIFHKDKGQLLVKYNYIYMYWSLLTTPQMAIWSSTYLSSLKYLKHAGTDLHVGQIIQRKWETRQEAYLAWYKRVA